MFLLFLFIFFYKPSWGAVTWIWSSEIFSLNVRAQGVGMAGQTQNIANAIVQQFFPLFLLGAVFERFLTRYVSINSFTETVLRTSERGEIMRWSAKPGRRPTL